MKLLSIKVHAVMDYLLGAFIMASPWMFGFNDHASARFSTVSFGLAIFALSLLSNYGPGLIKIISLRFHLSLDAVFGILLAASPWMFGFAEIVYLPQLLSGIAAAVLALITERTAVSIHPSVHSPKSTSLDDITSGPSSQRPASETERTDRQA